MAIAYVRWSPPSVFVAYHRSLSDQIKQVADALNRTGVVRCEYLPLSAEAKHDGLLEDVYAQIDKADYVVGAPGRNASFVDHELSAASATDKPVLLLLADGVESTPNTTHSSCPILLMDRLAALRISFATMSEPAPGN